MKNIIFIVFLVLFLSQETFANTSSFKIYTPNHKNRYNQYLPPPPNINNRNYNNRFWQRRNYYNGNNYNYPYTYYPQRRSVFSSIGDFFSRGKMTGYTDSNFGDIPYFYQDTFQSPNGSYYMNNYDIPNGVNVKIID